MDMGERGYRGYLGRVEAGGNVFGMYCMRDDIFSATTTIPSWLDITCSICALFGLKCIFVGGL